MPPPKGLSGSFFFQGPRQNSAHHEAYCLGCIRHYRQVQFTWEILMIELLAAEESNEAPDNGALSWSGDKFEL
ncbi:hypothetical protein B0H10DRAFT_2094028 [Mycena sp. CBHHK59/15]|nr:hypothetical protein B0H10DRAFT_2094028 [Mycena sp. CBHHK59/15]